MRYAVISDIHANRQALDAVLADIEAHGVDCLLCLGDVVGYGPAPEEVLNAVRERTPNIVVGNHDAAACGRLDPKFFNDNAKAVIDWTAAQLSEGSLAYLRELPAILTGGDGILAAHAEVAQPERFDYIDQPEEARPSFKACKDRIILVGHTHRPGIFALGKDAKIASMGASDVPLEKGVRYLINPGSVGDPRSRDFRACYCLIDTEENKVRFRRVGFDMEAYRQEAGERGLPVKPFFVRCLEDEAAMADATAGNAMRGPVLMTAGSVAPPKHLILPAPVARPMTPPPEFGGPPPPPPRNPTRHLPGPGAPAAAAGHGQPPGTATRHLRPGAIGQRVAQQRSHAAAGASSSKATIIIGVTLIALIAGFLVWLLAFGGKDWLQAVINQA